METLFRALYAVHREWCERWNCCTNEAERGAEQLRTWCTKAYNVIQCHYTFEHNDIVIRHPIIQSAVVGGIMSAVWIVTPSKFNVVALIKLKMRS